MREITQEIRDIGTQQTEIEQVQTKRTGRGLYRPEFEHDNCGIGAVINSKGIKTHGTVENALHIV